MNEWKEYTTLIGAVVFAFLIVFLFYPGSIFTSVSFIDAELSESSTSGIPVRTKMDLALKERLKDLPLVINEWVGRDQNRPQVIEKQLGADILLMRAYTRADLEWPVFLLVMQSSSKPSFHPPLICYPVAGYDIEEVGEEDVHVTDTAWADLPISEEQLSRVPGWQRKALELSPYAGLISVKRLVVFKQVNDNITDRRVILYFFIKDKAFASGKISMVRVSTLIPPSSPYNDELRMTAELMGAVIPLMFKPAEEGKMAITRLVEGGMGGYFVILLLFFIPLAIIIIPKVWASRSGD